MPEKKIQRSQISLFDGIDRQEIVSLKNFDLAISVDIGEYDFCSVAHELWRVDNTSKLYDLAFVLGTYHDFSEFLEALHGEAMWDVLADLTSKGEDPLICKDFLRDSIVVVGKALSGKPIKGELTREDTEALNFQVEKIFLFSQTHRMARNYQSN